SDMPDQKNFCERVAGPPPLSAVPDHVDEKSGLRQGGTRCGYLTAISGHAQDHLWPSLRCNKTARSIRLRFCDDRGPGNRVGAQVSVARFEPLSHWAEPQMKDIRENLERRRAGARAGGGERRIEAQHKRGKLTARERLELLMDKG